MRIASIERRPLWWQTKGLYNGRRDQPTTLVITLEGDKRLRRVYVFQCGNSGTAYVKVKGRKYAMSDFPEVGDILRPWGGSEL